MKRLLPIFSILVFALARSVVPAAEIQNPKSKIENLASALVFHAPFDATADAVFARGDRRVFTAAERGKRDAAAPGLPADATARLAPGAGRFGGALEFRGATKQQVFFRGPANLGFPSAGPWAGSVSLWLRIDPERDLAPGYCDPFQFVGARWGDGALFVEFTKDHTPRHFRYGIFPVTKLWNPQGKKLEEMTDAERPMVPVRRPIFGRDRWTHILITFAHLNSGRADGRGTLFVDGERIGASEGWTHTFAWADPAQTALTLGLNYTGLIDDLAVFARELTAAEARAIFNLPRGIAQLHSPPTMKLHRLLPVILFLASAPFLASASAPAGFVSLFNGRDLAGWKTPVGDGGHWKVLNGVIDYDARSEATGDKNLWSEKEYKDFVLRIDWRIKETHGLYNVPTVLPDGSHKKGPDGKDIITPMANADSGIYLRGSSKAQLNIWCWPIGSGEVYGYRMDQKMPPAVRAGVTPKVRADKPVGEWNTFEITLKGDRLTVVLNGKKVIDRAQLPGVPEKGAFALQHHGGFKDGKYNAASSLMQFRNISIKEL